MCKTRRKIGVTNKIEHKIELRILFKLILIKVNLSNLGRAAAINVTDNNTLTVKLQN